VIAMMAGATTRPVPGRPVGKGVSPEVAEAKLHRAAALGQVLAELVADPAAFASALGTGLAGLADRDYHAGTQRVAPGIGPLHGVRQPYQAALRRAFRQATRRASPSQQLLVADRLLREREREAIWFAIAMLERLVVVEPERSWQLLRRAASEASDWITVDTLARPFGKGVLFESYRWAELEQLTVSPSRWERRLVGSTIATMPFLDHRAGREPVVAAKALSTLGLLVGDREPDVQKALAWGYRSMASVDPAATTAALEAQAATAERNADGHRAWVVRDSLTKLEPATAERIRARLGGIRRLPGAPSTSEASKLAERFVAMGLGRRMPEPPLT
jgi:3-methyladenine DNA glycosylase AlkD